MVSNQPYLKLKYKLLLTTKLAVLKFMLFHVRSDCQPLHVRGTAVGTKQQQAIAPEMSFQDTWWSARRLLQWCNRHLTPAGV